MFHRKAHKIVNFLITVCLLGFLMIFLNAPSTPTEDLTYPREETLLFASEDVAIRNDSSQSASKLAYDVFKSNNSSTLSGLEIVKMVNYMNLNFEVLNVDRFGPVEDVKTVIVIQVHSRLPYLRYLIESLEKTDGIEKALLVFSHDINVDSINELIKSITFARVYQIFYPLNMQLFPHVFPGQDPRDCPEKIGKEGAETLECHNKDHPDKYGNYRVAKLTQIKHHWWWKMNFVFDGIVDKYGLHNAWILLLEEDHLVVPDALRVLDYITTNKHKLCANCDLISLGAYLKSTSKYGDTISQLGAHPWFSSKHNMGMAFQKKEWEKIKGCAEMFCTFDDYNWDWSVMRITVGCLPQRFRVIFAKSPRIFHIGECGVHNHKCTASNAYKSATDLLNSHKSKLFPEELRVTDVSRRSLKPSKANGGWGDTRDHELCRLNTYPLRWNDGVMNMTVISELLTSSVTVN